MYFQNQPKTARSAFSIRQRPLVLFFNGLRSSFSMLISQDVFICAFEQFFLAFFYKLPKFAQISHWWRHTGLGLRILLVPQLIPWNFHVMILNQEIRGLTPDLFLTQRHTHLTNENEWTMDTMDTGIISRGANNSKKNLCHFLRKNLEINLKNL